ACGAWRERTRVRSRSDEGPRRRTRRAGRKSEPPRHPPLPARGEERMKPAGQPQAGGDGRTDRDLVYAARDGVSEAFDALFYRYRDGIFRLGLGITSDPSDADEVVIDTFARAHGGLARLEADGSPRPGPCRA